MTQWANDIDKTQRPCRCMYEDYGTLPSDLNSLRRIKNHRMLTEDWCYFSHDNRPRKRGDRGGTRGFRVRRLL